MATKTTEVRLSSREAAARLGITEGTLRNWRTEGAGPTFHTLQPKRRRKGKGSRPRVYYLAHEVDAYKNGGSRAG